jgi:ubiquinone/menaquinone biosynthesis C-methylase UbiE
MTLLEPLTQEREFESYWERHLVDPRDPQLERWRKLERTQVARAREQYVPVIERHITLSTQSVLDVGCQCGALAVALSERGAQVTGVDVEDSLLEGARKRAGGYGVSPVFLKAVAEQLPFESGHFSLVTMIDVIEHVQQIEQSLRECVRVVRPGGLLVLQGPNRLSPRWLWSDPHYRMFGISVLPQAAGRWYVTKVRRRPRYDVGSFPIGWLVLRSLRALGMSIVQAPGIDDGERKSHWDYVLGTLFRSMFTIVAKKPDSQTIDGK